MSHTHTRTHRLSGTLYDGPGSKTWDRHRDQGTQAVPQVQFRHGNVILKHSRLKVDEKGGAAKGGAGREREQGSAGGAVKKN